MNLLGTLLLALSCTAKATPVRMGLILSNNHGLSGELPLIYSDSDAARLAQTLKEVGGFLPENLFVIPNASPDSVATGLADAVLRSSALHQAGEQTLLFVYYTGHAGTDGLHLGDQSLPLSSLKASARVVPAEQRIFAIDACQSGNLFRSKGATLIDVRSRPKEFEPPSDEAWITSSGPEEQSFEVDRRRGALFSHYLISGLRGAADFNRDHAVTLNELFEFVGRQTNATAAALGQRQKPQWDGSLGEVVFSNLSQVSTGLKLNGPLSEALLLVNTQTVAVEAEIPPSSDTFVALSPGTYQLISLSDDAPKLAEITLAANTIQELNVENLLKPVSGVRSKGGLLVKHVWTSAAGYAIGMGTTPARRWTAGPWIALHKNTGEGHHAGVIAEFDGGSFQSDSLVGKERRLLLSGEWFFDTVWQGVESGPGIRVGAGWLHQNAERTIDPTWGQWFGSNSGPLQLNTVISEARLQWHAHQRIGALQLHAIAGVGLNAVWAGRTQVYPSAGIEIGTGVPF